MAALESGHHHAGATIIDDRPASSSAPQMFQNAADACYGPLDMLAGAQGLLRRLLLHARRAGELARAAIIQTWARRLGLGHRTGIDIPGEFGGPGAGRASGATPATRSTRSASRSDARRRRRRGGAVQVRRHRAAVVARATTSTSRSARATCRRRRCRWRSPTRRSPTAARSCGRTSARAIEDGLGRAVEEIRPSRRGARSTFSATDQATIMDGLRARGRSEDGGTSADVFKGFPASSRSTARRAPSSARASPTSPGTPAYVPAPRRARSSSS